MIRKMQAVNGVDNFAFQHGRGSFIRSNARLGRAGCSLQEDRPERTQAEKSIIWTKPRCSLQDPGRQPDPPDKWWPRLGLSPKLRCSLQDDVDGGAGRAAAACPGCGGPLRGDPASTASGNWSWPRATLLAVAADLGIDRIRVALLAVVIRTPPLLATDRRADLLLRPARGGLEGGFTVSALAHSIARNESVHPLTVKKL